MTIFLSLGSNIGDSPAIIQEAFKKISSWPEVLEPRLSSLYCTSAVSLIKQDDFINAVMSLETKLSPDCLMKRCWLLEKEYGIKKPIIDGPRALDIDLLFYNEKIIETKNLSVPHPHWKKRLFVLLPLQELTPNVGEENLNRIIDEAIASFGKEQQIDKLV